MCTEEGRLRTIGVALSFKVRNSRSWSRLEPADFRNGVRLVYHEGSIGTTSNVGVPTKRRRGRQRRQELRSAAGEPQADGAWYREPLARGRQPAVVGIAPEHHDGVRPLIGDEQPPPARIQTEIARPVALGGDHLLERERAR